MYARRMFQSLQVPSARFLHFARSVTFFPLPTFQPTGVGVAAGTQIAPLNNLDAEPMASPACSPRASRRETEDLVSPETRASLSHIADAAAVLIARADAVDASVLAAVQPLDISENHFAHNLERNCQEVAAAARALMLQTKRRKCMASCEASPKDTVASFEADLSVLSQRLDTIEQAAALGSPHRRRESGSPSPARRAESAVE